MEYQKNLPQRVRLASENNAIELMALAIEWSQHLAPELLEESASQVSQIEELAQHFTEKREFPGFQINLNQNTANFEQTSFNLYDFLRITPSGKTEWSLSLRPEFYSCSCSVYDRWDNVKPIVTNALKLISNTPLEKGSLISGIGLQYSDVFRWQKEDVSVVGDLLRPDSDLLPKSIFDRNSIWHTHNGWFSKSDSGHKVLNTFNMDLLIEADECVLRITGQHRFMSVWFEDDSPSKIDISDLDAIACHLHNENKFVLQEILSDEGLRLINMDKVHHHE